MSRMIMLVLTPDGRLEMYQFDEGHPVGLQEGWEKSDRPSESDLQVEECVELVKAVLNGWRAQG